MKNCDLSSLALQIKKSDISSLKYVNTRFPKSYLENGNTDFFEVKEAFRQLKRMAESNKDKIQERIYGASELEAYWRYLIKENQSLWERFPLYLSKVSNDYGRSWPLALFGLVFFSACFYYMIGVFQWNGDPELWRRFFFSGTFFQFLIPTHDLQSILGVEDIAYRLIYVVDFFQRIISGFYIYQLIRAFRFHYNT